MDVKALKKFLAKARALFKQEFVLQLQQAGVSEDLTAATSPSVQALLSPHLLSPLMAPLLNQCSEKTHDALAEVLSYTWFHRLCVIRYLELNQQLSHGVRVLSSATNSNGFQMLDEVVEHCDALGLDKQRIIELKLAADQDAALFRLILLGQCQQLSAAMPFLFANELGLAECLLPQDLTRTNSIVRFVVDELPEQCWQSIDIFTALFDGYYVDLNKELPKKIGHAELAKATQTVEPRWVSQYMLENTLGRRWLELQPASTLAAKLTYYLPSAEQPPQVADYLLGLASNAANPEYLRVLDPACGSGQMLVQAYAILKNIYLEKGYQLRDIPQLIFRHNLFGLDICQRAMQMTGVTLVLLALQDDRRYLTRPASLNLFNLRCVDETAELPAAFKRQCMTLGALAERPQVLPEGSSASIDASLNAASLQQVFQSQFDVVVCYPPNLGIIGAGDSLEPLKQAAKQRFPSTKSNLATMFFNQASQWLKPNGLMSLILKDSWLFLSRYEQMREILFQELSLTTLAHFGRSVIPEQHQMNAAVIRKAALPDYLATFCFVDGSDLTNKNLDGQAIQAQPVEFPPKNKRHVVNSLSRMKMVPTKPLSYWLSADLQRVFQRGKPLAKAVKTKACSKTADRENECRHWWELPTQLSLGTSTYWKPLATGGSFRRWYGNSNLRVRQDYAEQLGLFSSGSGVINSWTAMSPIFNAREIEAHTYVDSSGPCFAVETAEQQRLFLLGVFNSKVFDELVKAVYPEGVLGSIRPADLAAIPIPDSTDAMTSDIADKVQQLVALARRDWQSVESGIEFTLPALLHARNQLAMPTSDLQQCYQQVQAEHVQEVSRALQLERAVNNAIQSCYELAADSTEPVPVSAISLQQNPFYQSELIDIDHSDAQTQQALTKQWLAQHQAEQVEQLISYLIGCLMGRFATNSATASGSVVLGHDQAPVFEQLKAAQHYLDYPLDIDGIVPLAAEAWTYPDDATAQLGHFVKKLFGAELFPNNMAFIAESLRLKYDDLANHGDIDAVIRGYMTAHFFKEHCRRYQRKPIYWLFSSGKERAFQCLIYLHRMTEATLPRLRIEYVVPQLVRFESQLEFLQEQMTNASPAELRGLEAQQKCMLKKQAELRQFDEKLKHYADMRININLEDGVRVNYAKFADLLVDVKAITGDKGD